MIFTIVDNSFLVAMLQIIVPILNSPPFNLDTSQSSIFTSIGTFSVLVNAFGLYLVNYTCKKKDEAINEKKDLEMEFQAPLIVNPILSMNNNEALKHSMIN